MRAVEVSGSGGPEVLRLVERDRPAPGPGQVLVDVAAAGVDYTDIHAREGRPPYGQDTPFVLGAEGAGTVSAVGEGVTGAELLARAGDLFGWIADGSLDVRIGRTYGLADAAAAHEDLAGRRSTGKLLLTP